MRTPLRGPRAMTPNSSAQLTISGKHPAGMPRAESVGACHVSVSRSRWQGPRAEATPAHGVTHDRHKQAHASRHHFKRRRAARPTVKHFDRKKKKKKRWE